MFDPRLPTEVQLILDDLTPEERARIAAKFPRIMPRAWLGISIAAVWWAICATMRNFDISDFLLILVLGLGLNVAGDRWQSRSVVKALRRELAAMGRCAGCGYIIREMSGTCSECGAPV